MDSEVLKALKAMQSQINDTNKKIEQYLLDKHEDNSTAIDDITLVLLESAGK